jgi:hypothetical protein
MHKILVGRKDGDAASTGNGAQEEVGIGPLDSASSAPIAILSRKLKVFLTDGRVWKCLEVTPQGEILFSDSNAREQLLPHGPQHRGSALVNEFEEFL